MSCLTAAADGGSSRRRRVGSSGSSAPRSTARRRRCANGSLRGSRSPESITWVEELLVVADAQDVDGESESVLALIKSAPGNVSLEMLAELEKLEAVRAVALPARLFSDVTPRVLADWRQRASVESASHLREHPRALRLTLLAALLWAREREITDTLVDLLISTVHRIGARAQKKVTNELIGEFKKIANKETTAVQGRRGVGLASGRSRQGGGLPGRRWRADAARSCCRVQVLGPTHRRTVQTSSRPPYSHYRRGLIRLLQSLEFRSNNSVHRPVLDALELVARHAPRERLT